MSEKVKRNAYNPMFSIIVPMFNAENTILTCIDSVINQSEKDFELIVIDDGSTDDSLKQINQYLMHTNVRIISVQNTGVSNARNMGIKESTGNYIVFLDADDKLPLNTLQSYKRCIEENEKPDMIMSGFYRDYPKKVSQFRLDIKKDCKYLFYDEGRHEFEMMHPRFIGCVWGKCYKREIIECEQFDMSLSLCEDAEFNFRVFEKVQKCVYIDECLYHYTYSVSSTIRRYNQAYIDKYTDAIVKMDKEVSNHTKKYYWQFACNVFNVICFNVIFSPENPMKTRKKIGILKELHQKSIFKTVIDNVELNDLPIKHRVVIYMAKRKWYLLICFMAKVNMIINKLLY